jgi:hypothetical protein
MADTPEKEEAGTPLGGRLGVPQFIEHHEDPPPLADIAASESYPLDPGTPEEKYLDLTDRQLLARIHAQLAYLVDVLAPHGQVIRAVDLVADTYGPQGPLFGRLDHADVQSHAIQAQLDKMAEPLGRVDQFIKDNQDMLDRAKKMMGTGDALRRAMPGGHRRSKT